MLNAWFKLHLLTKLTPKDNFIVIFQGELPSDELLQEFDIFKSASTVPTPNLLSQVARTSSSRRHIDYDRICISLYLKLFIFGFFTRKLLQLEMAN